MHYLLPHLLTRAASQSPDQIAVVAGSDSVSYRELDRISDRLAAVLSSHGVARGDRVGIFLPKSMGAIVGIYGIMKAGAVYVPVDPAAPPGRVAYIVENCGIRVLLTSAKKAAAVEEILSKGAALDRLILLDDSAWSDGPAVPVVTWTDVLGHDGNAPVLESIETDLAYILYTSGSTGVPKGVMISHRNSLTFVDWAHDAVGATSEDRFSSHAPLHFDLSVFDLFVACKAAATLVLVPDGLSSFPFRLAEWIEKERISVWYSVPTILSLLVRSGDLGRFRYPHLRTIIFAGEVFPVKYLRDLMALVPKATYFNFYGPTETNVITYYRVPPIPEDRTAPIPIGIACANTEVFAIADDGKRVSRTGEVGELYARGSLVAQGYWGDAEKTQRHFVANPLSRGFRETAYRTGDIVTLDDDGNYVFLGRRDDMVKSRGYRIELGEVETTLYRHEGVREAAVVALPDPSIGNRLVAFVVLSDEAAADAEDLHEFCGEHLPRYMVPESIELRDHLPKTSTGKVDKVELARRAGGTAPAGN
ncbi:MAG TPA: amino acid adenylation domain-containing protein [Candidatus Krumholzibacteria bacterium]|nr:amino acid adenylation domain-containing protein [Candidatus Krumholzibacteria bacterium]